MLKNCVEINNKAFIRFISFNQAIVFIGFHAPRDKNVS